MLAIWLLVINYSIKGNKTTLAKKRTNTIFFIKLLLTLSMPFAIIIAAGNSESKNSVSFLIGIKKAKSNATSKFMIRRIQLFLNELFTENALGDFKNIAVVESVRISTSIH
jgi:hypothetical protein